MPRLYQQDLIIAELEKMGRGGGCAGVERRKWRFIAIRLESMDFIGLCLQMGCQLVSNEYVPCYTHTIIYLF